MPRLRYPPTPKMKSATMMLTHESSGALKLNQQDSMPVLSNNGNVALRYAAAGFFVFPCGAKRKDHKPGVDRLPFGKAEKTPIGVSSWSKEATTDPETILPMVAAISRGVSCAAV